MPDDITLWAAIGFLLAAYAVVGNDALQTLGTFINSNHRFHWTVLFGFAGSVLIATFTYGWMVNHGDPSFGRLGDTAKYPPFPGGPQWYHILPPLGLLALTRFGVPVSTSFMVLAIFATMDGLSKMMQKSLIGYGLAFGTGVVLYLLLTRTLEAFFKKNPESENRPHWIVLQWASTTWLWSVWLMQDFANIFVFLPRELSALEAFGALALILVLLAITFANKGGPVQKILRSKTAVTDIRSATIIDFVFAGLLYFFKELSNIPMSTTWVFLGLIAGREFAFSLTHRESKVLRAAKLALSDLGKAYIGLVISVDMARGLPWLARSFDGGSGFAPRPLSELWETPPTMWFLIVSNALLIPVVVFLKNQNRATSIVMFATLAAGAVAFFLLPIS